MSEIERASWEGTAEPEGSREKNGHFGRGNKLSPGSATLRHAHEVNSWFRGKVTRDKIEALEEKLYTMAVAGDLVALKIYLERCGGRPTQAVEITTAPGNTVGLGVMSDTSWLLRVFRDMPEARIQLAQAIRERQLEQAATEGSNGDAGSDDSQAGS